MSLDEKMNEFEIVDNICEDSLSVSNVKQSIKELKEEFEKNDWENNTLDVAVNRNKIIVKVFGEGLI